jgi:formylglycine-generating enzyme required for sulfatase activity
MKEPTIGTTIISPVDGMQMVFVPAGEFLMGASDDLAFPEEKPQHTVYLDAFWIDQTEVTNSMFAAFLNSWGNEQEGGATWLNDANGEGHLINSVGGWQVESGYESHPVVEVTWFGARAYCQWAGRQLPTEAQWEKAARGTDDRIYPWGNSPTSGELGNFADVNSSYEWSDDTIDDGYELTSPVGFYVDGASPYGALDMAGNVWEWVADWYDEAFYQYSPIENPAGPQNGVSRLIRGGSFGSNLTYIRSTNRYWAAPDVTTNSTGFRCLMNVSDSQR